MNVTAGSTMNEPTTRIGERVYADIYLLNADKANSTVYGGYSCMIIAVDSFCSMLHVIPCLSKHSESVCEALGKLVASYKEFGHEITELHTDAESTLAACAVWLGMQQIQLKLGEPKQHCRRIERQVRTVNERKACIESASPIVIPRDLEGESVRTAVYHLNDQPNSKNHSQSPRMMFEGKRLDLGKRQTIPYGTVVQLPFIHEGAQRMRLGVVLGPAPRTYNANNCYVFDTKKIVVRGRVKPVEIIPEYIPWKVKKGIHNFTNIKNKSRKKKKPTGVTPGPIEVGTAEIATPVTGAAGGTPVAEVGRGPTLGGNDDDVVVEDDVDDGSVVESYNVPPAERHHEQVKVSPRPTKKLTVVQAIAARKRKFVQGKEEDQRNRRLLARLVDAFKNSDSPAAAADGTKTDVSNETMEVVDEQSDRQRSAGSQSQRKLKAIKQAMRAPTPSPEPSRRSKRQAERKIVKVWKTLGTRKARAFADTFKISVKESLEGEHARESREAINSEILNMLQYKVGHYKHFKDIPADKRRNILQSFMFLKHKTTPDGRYDKTKARMVGNGATQKTHMYDLVSSSTVALSSVFLLCNLASFYRAKLTTYDIKGAFLHAEFGEKDEVTYIRINKEITALWIIQDPTAIPFVDERGTLLLELDKFIYGLKQSPLKFQEHLISVLVNLGYRQLSQDECLFIKHDGEHFSLLSTHVDDIMQVATRQQFYDELKKGLIDAFADITTTEEGDAYLGMSIERSQEDYRVIKLSQRGLIDKVLEKYPMADGDRRKYFSPADDDLFDVTATEDKPVSAEERSEFLSVLMTLMYLARLTRPDILMAVTFLASRTHCATTRDVGHLMRIIRYLEKTREVGVYLNCDSLDLHCSCDASYAVHSPGGDTKGHTGFVVGFGSNMSYLHGRSSKQKGAATSSSDAEIFALCEALKMCVWMRELIRELQITDLCQVTVQQDNKSVILMSTEATLNKNSKHVLTKLTYIKELVKRDVVKVVYLCTKDMTADVLSKPLHGASFYRHITNMMGLQWRSYFGYAKSDSTKPTSIGVLGNHSKG